jgi:hypothetical protein
MKKLALPLLALVMLVASCSSPRYAYYFDHYDYAGSQSEKIAIEESTVSDIQPESVLASFDEQTLMASSSAEPVLLAEPVIPRDEAVREAAQKFSALSKAEKKEVRKEMVKSVKEYKKAVKAGDNEKASEMAKRMDGNLKLALIFGAIGIALSILGQGWLGGIAILVGIVFLIVYLVNQ